MNVKVSDVKVGKRARKDLGDVQSLADSISDVGLLQPLVLLPDNTLVAGGRRLAAVKLLKWTEVPAVVIQSLADAAAILQAERDENTCRKDFTPEEAVAIGEAIREATRKEVEAKHKASNIEAGKQSGKARRGEPNTGKTLPSVPRDESKRTDAKVAKSVGMSRPTYEKARKVVESGDRQLIDEMNRTGKVDPVHKKLEAKSLPKIQPRPKFAASDEIMGRLGSVLGVFADIEGKYGGHLELVERDDWDQSQTPYFVEILRANAERCARIAKELKHANPK